MTRQQWLAHITLADCVAVFFMCVFGSLMFFFSWQGELAFDGKETLLGWHYRRYDKLSSHMMYWIMISNFLLVILKQKRELKKLREQVSS